MVTEITDVVAVKLLEPWVRGDLRDPKKFGVVVRSVRIALRLSQRRLSHMTGLTMATISRVENGGGIPHLETVDTLITVFTEVQRKRKEGVPL